MLPASVLCFCLCSRRPSKGVGVLLNMSRKHVMSQVSLLADRLLCCLVKGQSMTSRSHNYDTSRILTCSSAPLRQWRVPMRCMERRAMRVMLAPKCLSGVLNCRGRICPMLPRIIGSVKLSKPPASALTFRLVDRPLSMRALREGFCVRGTMVHW